MTRAASADDQYAGILRDCLGGERVTTRNSEVRRAIGLVAEFDRTPLVCVRRTPWRLALREMQWFLSGSSNVADLHPSVRHWWAPWADAEGEVRNNYGSQFRRFAGRGGDFDQIEHLIAGVRDHPYSRRNVATTWNPADMADAATPITNCHGSLISAHVGEGGRLSLVMVQRSADVVVGLPSNWLQYAAFHLWLAARVGRPVGTLIWFGLDVHVYEAHLEIAHRMLDRSAECGEGPALAYTPTSEDFLADDFSLAGGYAPLIDEKVGMII